MRTKLQAKISYSSHLQPTFELHYIMSFHAPGQQGSHLGGHTNTSYDFQETYEGLGEVDDDDALNSETFGVSDVGKDFDFGQTAVSHSTSQTINPQISYARAAANDDDFMKDLWGMPAHNKQDESKPIEQEKKFLSLEEIEALLSQSNLSQRQGENFVPPQQQYYPGAFPQNQFGGFMVPQGFIPPPGPYGVPPPPQFVTMQHPNGYMMNQGQGFPAAPIPAEAKHSIGISQAENFTGPRENVPQHTLGDVSNVKSNLRNESGTNQAVVSRDADKLGEFPLLGAPNTSSKRLQAQKVASHSHDPKTEEVRPEELAPINEEQHALMLKRQEKVARIMRYSGVMNPKDKDFVTRFQLSQIVTDDPYNEDFYAQVYRVIHPKSTPGALAPSHGQQEPNSIAQAYLDQSGHRLGGRFKRADVALQRMQQQVQKAVSVAKERQSLPHNEREGVLGKISVGSGKKPRQQLTILSKAAQRAKDVSSSASDDQPIAPSQRVKKYTRKDILAILEDIINNLMAVESDSRTDAHVDTSSLWNSLHVLDSSSSSGDDELFVNPFIQCLNHEKALKILPRLFKFLSRQQTLTIVTLVMSNLENLNVIKEGSYTIYPNKTIPSKVLRLVDIYSLTFCKILMNSVQEFKFHEIIGLLVILIQHNVVSFVSTTKIGLSIITSLLSRAELIRGEGTISATDLSEWTSCYDELFTALESRLAAIFPPSNNDSQNDYVWQFLATLSLGGKLSHQRIIVDEVRDEIFGVMNRAKAIANTDMDKLHEKQSMLNNLNMYLVVMGLVATENEILELQN